MKRKLTFVLISGLVSVFITSFILPSVVNVSNKAYAAAGDGLAATYGIPLNADKSKPVFSAAQIKSAEWLDANQITVTFTNGLKANFFPVNDADNGLSPLYDQRVESAR
ncbi:hypothetical protein EBQ81_00460, partial [bacterium]|nr:hypothetical protein [bacterium]